MGTPLVQTGTGRDDALTPLSLLERAAARGEAAAWARLVAVYTPLLRAWVVRYQVQPADADDLTQEVLLHVARGLPEFRHNGHAGAFRSWLRTVLVFRLHKFWRARGRHLHGTGDSAVEDRLRQLEDPTSELSGAWDREHDRHVLGQLLVVARDRFSETTWRAFQRTMIDEAPTADVARELGVSPNAVLVAKSRVLRELRREARGLVD